MQIAITGITGFIGKNLLKSIRNDGNQYVCLIRNNSNIAGLLPPDNVSFMEINFNPEEISSALENIDVVIHMIGQMGGYGIPLSCFEDANCRITKDISIACKDAGIQQLIYLSTPGVQGFGHRLCKEDVPYAPRNLYEQTKVRAEEIIIEQLANTSVKYTILRPDFVYGPEDLRRVKMYKNIRSKKFVLTTSGRSYLHPTYVMDVIQGITKSINNPKAYNEIFNISAASDITVKEYLDTIADYFDTQIIHINIGYNLSILLAFIIEKLCNILLKRDGFVSRNKIDFLALDHSTSNEKAQKLLNYHAEYNFHDGFYATMEWYKDNSLL